MTAKRYFVVEFRLPIEVTDAQTVEEAAGKARQQWENKMGVSLSNWFCRVFVYGEDYKHTGPLEEWFANPTGSHFYQIDENFDKHERMIDEQDSSEEVD